MGYPTGILIDAKNGTPTDNNIKANNLLIQNTTIAGCAKPLDYAVSSTAPTGWSAADVTNWFSTSTGNSILNTNDEVKLAAAYNYTTPDFTPQTGSPLLTGASFSNAKVSGSFFTAVGYRGAVGSTGDDATWWKGWTLLDLSK